MSFGRLCGDWRGGGRKGFVEGWYGGEEGKRATVEGEGELDGGLFATPGDAAGSGEEGHFVGMVNCMYFREKLLENSAMRESAITNCLVILVAVH